MNSVKINYKSEQKVIDQIETVNRYNLKSNCLSWNENYKTLTFNISNDVSHKYDFRIFYFPPCKGCPKSTSVASNELYINTLLFQIDESVSKLGQKTKERTKSVSRPIYIFMCVMTYFRKKGIYTLNTIQPGDMDKLAVELGKNKWNVILEREKMWQQSLADPELKNNNIDELFNITTAGHICSINKEFWGEKIGYGACDTYSYETKQCIFQYCKSRGWLLYTQSFKEWIEKETNESFYSAKVLSTMYNRINQLAKKKEGIDYLQNVPFFNVLNLSSKYCKRPDERTDNISLSDGTYILKRSLELVFDHGPIFIEILKRINQQEFIIKRSGKNSQITRRFKDFTLNQTQAFLKNEKPFDDLTNSMGLPPIRYWAPSPSLPSDETAITLIHFISLIQSASCVAIMFLNGRRTGEVADEETGLRITDLATFNEEDGIYQCKFYIEKTYQDRHSFYVNRSTANAIQLLIDMKVALSDLLGKHDNEYLFSVCNPFPLSISKNETIRYFCFTHTNSTLSTFYLMRYIYPDGNAPNLKGHMGRRFFGLLYHYRYDNSDLLSLSQHFRHYDLTMTKIYITDPDFREEVKNIAATIGNRKDVTFVDKKLYDSLELEVNDLKDEIEAAGKERLTDVITRIISGEHQSAGGFTSVIRRLFRKFSQDIEFVSSSRKEQGQILSERLQANGYKPNCMPHGQCNVPSDRVALNAKCKDEKHQTNTERACAKTCRECQYHYNNAGFLQNLEEDAKQLKEDMTDFMLPPLQQQRAQVDYDNLISIIELNKKNMQRNQELMLKTREELYEQS